MHTQLTKNLLLLVTSFFLLSNCNTNNSVIKDSSIYNESQKSIGDIAISGEVGIEYFVQGEGSPIVLLPGGSLNIIYLQPLADALSSSGYQVIRVNPRGTGKSYGPESPVTMKDLAHDVYIVMEKLGLRKVDIAGHAFGNRISRALASYYPDNVRSVTLLAAGGTIEPEGEALTALKTMFNPKASEEDVLATMKYMVGDPAYYKKTAKIVAESRSPQAAGIQSLAMKSTDPSEWAVPKGDAPLLIIQGSIDLIAPPENGEMIKRKLGDRVTLKYIEGAGHTMLIERAEETSKGIISFLKSLK